LVYGPGDRTPLLRRRVIPFGAPPYQSCAATEYDQQSAC
jgi:hypothetical protein